MNGILRTERAKYWVRERLAGDVLGLGIAGSLLVLAAWTALGAAGGGAGLAATETAVALAVLWTWGRARSRWRARLIKALNLHPEALRIATRRGPMVRSRAEAAIADGLADSGIRFAYERRLVARNMTSRVPDFTIWDRFGSIWYLEHLGMLRSAEYRERWMASQRWYDRHFPGRLLVTTPGDLGQQIETVVGAMLGAAVKRQAP